MKLAVFVGKFIGLISAAAIQGISFGILVRYNIDITPAGILKTILPFLDPSLVEQIALPILIVLLILTLLPFIAIIKIFKRFGILGIIAYVIIFIITWLIVMML